MMKTKLEAVLDTAKNDEQQYVADIYYAEFDTDTKVRANYAFMHLVEYINLRNMGPIASAEFAVKLTRFIDVMTNEVTP